MDERFKEAAERAIDSLSYLDLTAISEKEAVMDRFSLDNDFEYQEEVREELGIRNKEELRTEMLEEWRRLGLVEGISLGAERKY